MATLLPAALNRVYTLIDPYLKYEKRGGIVNAGSPGYHTSREDLIRQGRSGDYSIQCPADKRGNPKYAAGIDITFGSLPELVVVHQRLRKACTPVNGEYDPRIECVREIIGTLDGRNVSGYNRVSTGSGGRSRVGWVSSGYSDDSHQWHEHISVLRDRVDNDNDMRGLAEVIAGLPAGALGWVGAGVDPKPPVVTPPVVVPPKPVLPKYTVKAGDTLSSIAGRLGTNWQSLAALNPGVNPDRIVVGQVLTVPKAVPAPKPEPEPEPAVHEITGVEANFLRRTDPNADRKEWHERIGNSIKHIQSVSPDFVLGQELDSVTAADVAKRLGSVWWYQRLKGIGVFWRSDVFDFTEGRNIQHYFSTRDNRYFFAVPVKHKKSGETIWLSTSHLENDGDPKTNGEAVRKVQATEIAAKSKAAGKWILGADFNSTTRSNGTNPVKPRVILHKAGWKFLTDQTGVTNRDYASHHGGLSKTPKGPWIDDIAWKGLTYVDGSLIRTDGTDSSDHHFLTATFKV